MKRLLPFLALLCFAPRAHATIAFVSASATACAQASASATNTCTLTGATTSGNTIIVGVATRTTSRNLSSVTGTGCTFFIYQNKYLRSTTEGIQYAVGRNCPSISSVTVTLSGTSIFEVGVAEYSGIASIGQFNNANGSSAAPSQSITTQDANNFVVMMSSSNGTDGIPTATTGNLRVANRTGSASTDAAIAVMDNTSASPGSVTNTAAITSSAWVTSGLELRTVNPVDPLLVDAVGTSASSAAGNAFVVYLPQATLAGNAIVCGVSYVHGLTLTPSDSTGSNTWHVAVTAANASGMDDNAIVYANNVVAGTDIITFTFNTTSTDFQAACKEAYHIDTSGSPTDGTGNATAVSGPSLACGAIVTGTDGDLIFQYGNWYNTNSSNLNNGGNAVKGFATGSGWTAIDSNTMTGQFFQNIRQTTHGSITPTYDEELDLAGTGSNAPLSADTWNTACVAFKTDNTKGNAPPATGIHIDHQTTSIATVAAINIDIPADGNFLALSTTPTGNTFTTKDSEQNSYTNNAPGNAFLIYKAGATVDVSHKIHVSATGGNNYELVVRDIRGAATSSAIDTTAINSGAQGSFTGGATITSAPSGLVPAAAGELVIYALQNGCGPPQNLSAPSGVITDSVYYTGQTDSDTLDEGEGHGHFFTTGTSSLSATWVMQNASCSGSGNAWGAAAWAINALPSVTVKRLRGGVINQ